MDILKEIIIQHFWGWESCEEKINKTPRSPVIQPYPFYLLFHMISTYFRFFCVHETMT